MWTLITASEDTVAEILFAAPSTIREDESPLNQHFSILAPSSQRKEGRSIHHFKQHQTWLQQSIRRVAWGHWPTAAGQCGKQTSGVQINMETNVPAVLESSAACRGSHGVTAPAVRCTFPIKWQEKSKFWPFEDHPLILLFRHELWEDRSNVHFICAFQSDSDSTYHINDHK